MKNRIEVENWFYGGDKEIEDRIGNKMREDKKKQLD